MKHIVKQHPPKALLEYLKTPNASWKGCPCKSEWKRSLLEEQGHICAYTMKRISEQDMKIEHFLPRGEPYEELALDYKNTLGVCNGNEGYPPEHQYADTRKGNAILRHIDPRDKDCERKLKYRANGEVRIDDPTLADELLDDPGRKPAHRSILNLNHQDLVDGRKRSFEAVRRVLSRKDEKWRLRDVKDMIEKYEQRNAQGQFEEYCMFVTYRLRKRLSKSK
ncbi:MAG: TIGR02646 family protein [Lewinellaceae bacterium]|nr:TIGR02646 family protein [Lewinellaceae bacterium]